MRSLPVLALSLALAGCTGVDIIDDPMDDLEPGDRAPGDPAVSKPQLQICTDGTIPQGLPTVGWSNFENRLITLGDPWHSSQDVVAVAGEATAIAGKFSYTAVSKDLQDERIEVYIDDCNGGYRLLGEQVSDDDGRIELVLDAADVPEVGEYGLYLRVMGDNSDARSRLRVYPAGARLIVFDIDATLTTSDSELVGEAISDILGGDVVSEARQDALAITELRHLQQGYELVYLTGRPYLLDGLTRDWLAELGFPSGTLHLTDDVANSWPSDGQVGEFKAGFLQQLLDAGFDIHAAYGNATSDIFAYEQAGIAKERTFILGDHGGEDNTVALGEGYTEHIEAIVNEPVADQPFVR